MARFANRVTTILRMRLRASRRVALVYREAAQRASRYTNAVALAQCGKPSALSTQARTRLRFLYIPKKA
ncbi:hypothetical protein CG402_04225 [Bifidobacteriaceae bacterium NR020]|nr:hypothetical protein CG402_04225 [Bifidobacteriaceae bacterium NR020]